MTRTSVRRRRLLVAGLVVGAGLLISAPVAGALAPPGPAERSPASAGHLYVVRPGDTVWSIAERAAGGGDPRSLVDAIASRNGIDAGWIAPGQTLVIPPAG